MWLKYVWHSSLDFIFGPHGYFRLVFGRIWLVLRLKKNILIEKVPKTCKKILLEVLDCNGGGPGRDLEGKNGLEGDC